MCCSEALSSFMQANGFSSENLNVVADNAAGPIKTKLGNAASMPSLRSSRRDRMMQRRRDRKGRRSSSTPTEEGTPNSTQEGNLDMCRWGSLPTLPTDRSSMSQHATTAAQAASAATDASFRRSVSLPSLGALPTGAGRILPPRKPRRQTSRGETESNTNSTWSSTRTTSTSTISSISSDSDLHRTTRRSSPSDQPTKPRRRMSNGGADAAVDFCLTNSPKKAIAATTA